MMTDPDHALALWHRRPAAARSRWLWLVAPAMFVGLGGCVLEDSDALEGGPAGSLASDPLAEIAERSAQETHAAAERGDVFFEEIVLVGDAEDPPAEEHVAGATEFTRPDPDDEASLTCGKPLRTSTDFNHGGSLFERYDVVTFGASCHSCFVRDHATVTHSGNGSCEFLAWAGTSPNDCRVIVGVRTSGGFVNGTCHVRVYEQIE